MHNPGFSQSISSLAHSDSGISGACKNMTKMVMQCFQTLQTTRFHQKQICAWRFPPKQFSQRKSESTKLTGIVYHCKARLHLSCLHTQVNEWKLTISKFTLNKCYEMQLQCKGIGDSVIQCPKWEKNAEDKPENISYMFGMQFNVILNCFSINLQM